MATSTVQVRIDDDLKAKATAVYEELGIDLSTAVRMFLKRSVQVNGIPFSMVLPYDSPVENSAVNALFDSSHNSANNGRAELTLDEINEEIAAVRNKRRS